MDQVKETLRGVLIGIMIYAVLVEMVGIFFSRNILAYTLGLLAGTAVAIFLLIHMAFTLDKGLDMQETQAVKYTRRQSFVRLGIMLAALFLGVIFDKLNFIALVLGLLGLKIGALFAPLFLKRMYPEHFVTKDELLYGQGDAGQEAVSEAGEDTVHQEAVEQHNTN